MPGWPVPVLGVSSPVMKTRVAMYISIPTIPSSIEKSMNWPRPVRSRARSAATAASAPQSAQVRSVTGTPIFTGALPPSSPVMDISPLIPWAMMSRPGRWAYGPSWPHPDAATKTRRGFSSERRG